MKPPGCHVRIYAVDAILTYNVADFRRYGGISAVQPAAVVA